MFDWLDDEMARIKTRKFHVVDGPASPELRKAVDSSDRPLPPSYKEFVLRYGNAKLYRYDANYYITVFAGPRELESSNGDTFVEFGRTWVSRAYFKESLLTLGSETPVFEWFQKGIRRTADGFEQWIAEKCAVARKRYKKKEWEAIEKGPPPFTELERSIVEARRHFYWRVVGIAPNDDVQFEISNGSAMVLPYLSVGIRGALRPPNSGPLNGGGFLPVNSIHPGQTKIVEYDCYKQFIAPEDTEVFELPDPGPEDREQYWEFKALS
ncbi:MAG: hypothetical protein R3C10_15275 [Pirellulales bacterium]